MFGIGGGDVFDEIIVVDTGSTDRTREIAREFGAKVFGLRLGRRLRGGAQRGTCRMRPVIMRFGSMPMMWLSRLNGRSCGRCWRARAAIGGRQEGSGASGVPPLTRPAGDLSPRGERRRQTLRATEMANAHTGTRRPRPRGEMVGVRGRIPRNATAAAPPLTRPAGDVSPPGRGDSSDDRAMDIPMAPRSFRLRSSCAACDPSPDGTGGGTVVDHIGTFPCAMMCDGPIGFTGRILPALMQPDRIKPITVGVRPNTLYGSIRRDGLTM